MTLKERLPHILVIDQSPDIRQVLQEFLGEEGYMVSAQPQLEDDLSDVIRLNPDLIIIDCAIGSGGDHQSMLDRLRRDATAREIPVILCTTEVRAVKDQQDYLEELGVPVVAKPFDLDILLDAIGAMLADRRSAPLA